MEKNVSVDVELLKLLQEACWSMRQSGGWEECPCCGSPADARGNNPFDWHAADCKFKVGYEKLKVITQVELSP